MTGTSGIYWDKIMNHEWSPIYNWLFMCDGETPTYIFNWPSSLMASWNGSDFPLSEFLFCRGMSMADKNISQGSRNAELTKKMAAWWTQPESGMNVQEEAGKGLVKKARQGQGHVLLVPWKTLKLRQLSSCMQDISSLTYTTLHYTAQIGFCILTLSARCDFKYGTFSIFVRAL